MQKGKRYVKHAVRGLPRSSVTAHTQGVDPYCTRDARYSRGIIPSKRHKKCLEISNKGMRTDC